MAWFEMGRGIAWDAAAAASAEALGGGNWLSPEGGSGGFRGPGGGTPGPTPWSERNGDSVGRGTARSVGWWLAGGSVAEAAAKPLPLGSSIPSRLVPVPEDREE